VDTRGGFAHGGWAAAGGDEVMTRWIGPIGSGGAGAMLMGRRSYESIWPLGTPRAARSRALNAAPKIRRIEQSVDAARLAQLDPSPR